MMASIRNLTLTIIATCTLSLFCAQKDPEYQLFLAVIKDNLTAVKILDPEGLNSPFSLETHKNEIPFGWDETDVARGQTPLYVAAHAGNLSIVQYYVDILERKGEDINPPSTLPMWSYNTPMERAAYLDHENVVNFYVKEFEKLDRNINPVRIWGGGLTSSPFQVALEQGFDDIVKIFVHRGVPLINVSGGKTAEEIARINQHERLAEYLHNIAPLSLQLLDECYGVKDLITSINGYMRELAMASNAANKKKIQNIIDGLIVVVNNTLLPRIHELIRKGAETDAQGKGGYTPLHCLIGYYNPEAPTVFDEAVKGLIKSRRVKLNALTDTGDSALTIAAKYGNRRIYKLLIQKKANPKIGNDPMKAAIESGHSDFVKAWMRQHK